MTLSSISTATENASATQLATNILAQFDVAGKNYITLSDIQNIYAVNPNMGDAAQEQKDFTQWDGNNDGRISHQELITGC